MDNMMVVRWEVQMECKQAARMGTSWVVQWVGDLDSSMAVEWAVLLVVLLAVLSVASSADE